MPNGLLTGPPKVVKEGGNGLLTGPPKVCRTTVFGWFIEVVGRCFTYFWGPGRPYEDYGSYV